MKAKTSQSAGPDAAWSRVRPSRRLAFVSDAVYPFNVGGKETRLYEVTSHLAKAGHEVDVYTMKWWRHDAPTVSFDGVRFHGLMQRRALYSGDRRSICQAVAFGLACLKLLTKRFDAVDVDHMPFFPLFTVRLICLVRRKRMTATWHEVWGRRYWLSYLGPAGAVAFAVEALAARMPDEIMAVSSRTEERLRTWLKVTSPIRKVLPGVNFSVIEAAERSTESVDVIYAGRLLPNKNIDILLEAVALSRADLPSLSCVIIGEGPERSRLEAQAKELGLAECVVFRDFGSYSDLYGRMKSSRVFVLPSDREGFGLTVLEANACGTPVVTIRHPDNAAQDLVLDGRNGLVTDLSAADLSRAILAILLGKVALAPREYLGELREAFDWDACAREVRSAMDRAGASSSFPDTVLAPVRGRDLQVAASESR